MGVAGTCSAFLFRWSLLLTVFSLGFGYYQVQVKQVCDLVSQNPGGRVDLRASDRKREEQLIRRIVEVNTMETEHVSWETVEESVPENLWEQPWEMVSYQSLDTSKFSAVQGLLFDFVQYYQTQLQFSSLPENEQKVEIRLLTRGPNSVLHSTHPALNIGVASLGQGTRFRIEVGETNGGGMLRTVVMVVVGAICLATLVFLWWWRAWGQRKMRGILGHFSPSVLQRHTHSAPPGDQDSGNLDAVMKTENTQSKQEASGGVEYLGHSQCQTCCEPPEDSDAIPVGAHRGLVEAALRHTGIEPAKVGAQTTLWESGSSWLERDDRQLTTVTERDHPLTTSKHLRGQNLCDEAEDNRDRDRILTINTNKDQDGHRLCPGTERDNRELTTNKERDRILTFNTSKDQDGHRLCDGTERNNGQVTTITEHDHPLANCSCNDQDGDHVCYETEEGPGKNNKDRKKMVTSDVMAPSCHSFGFLTSHKQADPMTSCLTKNVTSFLPAKVLPMVDKIEGDGKVQCLKSSTATTSTLPHSLCRLHHHLHTEVLSSDTSSSKRHRPWSLSSSSSLPSSASSSSSLCRHVRRVLLISLTMAAMTAVAVGVSAMKKQQEYAVHVSVPKGINIRKVRAFSTQPELSQLTDNPASLALVSRLQLLDLNNCHGNLSLCQTMAVCDGGDNDLLCRCRRGYYFHQQQCHECRTSCPEAHYLLTPCSSSADAVCTPCTHCSGSQYEAAVCTSTRDTICVDVTFPVGILPMNSSHYQDDGTPISHTHSPNVFLERLVHLKELETPMYVTNNQQTQDFVWHRESGIDIVVGISGVYLIPEYREMPAADDSQFFLTQSMETQRILDQFSSVQKEYCRHPVPDYYYLHLEVIRNRTTAAQVVRCDSRDPSQPRCPQGYKDGDRYLKWDINKHCNKFHPSGQPSDPLPKLKDGFNTVVCTDETDLDRDIFQLSRPVTLEMMFPSEECSQARQQCTQCLSSISAGCSEGDKANSCCGLSCYKKGACHKFHGPGCPQAAVECASGEVHRFTVMPVFSSMGHEWQCHLTYHQPAYLYNVSYSLSIPSLGFTVPAQTYTATAQTLYHHRHHSSKFHFIQVWHDTRMMVFRDILLKGNHQELNATSLSHMQPYVMHSLKDHSEFSRRKGFFTSKKEESAYTTTVQFERPFLYSSTSWYSNGCMKNVSGIFPNQTLYRNDAVKVTAKKVDRDGSFWYQVSHSDRSPYIKLSVAAGESVLQWFQGQTSQGTIIGESLKGLLVWVHTQNHWTITISGAVKECPSILTLHIFRKMMSSCAGIYDMLVACPKNFTLTFNVSRTDDNLPDIFVVKVKDMRSSHQLVLTSVLGPVNMPLTPLQARQQSVVMGEGADWFLWPSVLSVLVIAALGLAVICSIHAFIKHSAGKAAGSMAAYSTQPQETATLNNQATKPAEPRHHQSPLARRCLCIFVILYIIYSIVFSFCATLGLLYLTHHAMMVGVGGVSNFSQELQRELNASFHKVQLHESQEEVRLFHCVESRLQACSHHLQKQNREFLIRYQKYVTDLLSHVYLEQGAIQSLADQSIVQNKSVYAEEINQFLVDCNKTVQSILERFDSHFVVHAKEVTRNGWLDFPREIFLIQDEEPPNRKYMSSDQLARFFHWMLADKTDELFAISDTMSSRLSDIKLPSPSDHLKHIVTSPFEALLTSLPSEPRVAAHTFLLLDAPPFPAPSSHPSISSQHSLPAFLPHPRAALLYSEGPSDRSSIMGDGNISQPHNGSHSQPHVGRQGSHEKPSQSDGKEDAESGVVVYILIGLFLLMDVLLLVFRMYWLVNQLRAARAGYEDRIPTDPVCQKLLALQTGHPLSGLQEDVYQLPGYPVDTKDPMAEERTSENEFKVYFCQTYPKSKDDILREIMVQKISSTEQNLGQDRPPENLPLKQSQQGSRAKGRQTVRTCCYWLYRLLISHLLWQFVLTSLLVVMVCVVMYAGDWWLTTHNLRILVGGQSALRDLQLQVHMTNHHLAGLSTHLSTVLDSHTASVQSEIALATALLSSTLNIQRELLESLLARVCSGAGITICNTSSFNAVPLPELPTWQACNFLPTQPHLYQDVSGENLDEMVGQQLSPLLLRARHSVSSLGAVVVGVLCLLFLCQAGAVVGRCYLLVWGHLPRIHIFQISENTSMLLDNGPQGHRPMQRSSSWLESCESGVYVGDNEGGDTAQHHHHPQPNRDV